MIEAEVGWTEDSWVLPRANPGVRSAFSLWPRTALSIEPQGSDLPFQVALRVRPISVAELEEGATLIAHKVDEQVRGAVTGSCRQGRGLFTPDGGRHLLTW